MSPHPRGGKTACRGLSCIGALVTLAIFTLAHTCSADVLTYEQCLYWACYIYLGNINEQLYNSFGRQAIYQDDSLNSLALQYLANISYYAMLLAFRCES